MRVLFTKVTDDQHRFAVVRDDGSEDSADLETRSLLLHDLVHFALEAEAGLTCAFFGLLASGMPLARLNDRESPPDEEELWLAESLVGPMQSVFGGRLSRERYIEIARERGYDFVDAAFVEKVCERLRRLVGHWRGTAIRSTMALDWPPHDD